MNNLKQIIKVFLYQKCYKPSVRAAYDFLLKPILPFVIRHKKKIRVLFVLSELPSWKSEPLYLYMLSHDRFEPILGVIPDIANPGKENDVITYCYNKHYPYLRIDTKQNLVKQGNPDIVLLQQPYKNTYHPKHFFLYNPFCLYVYVNYGAFAMISDWWCNEDYIQRCWKVFLDNANTISLYSKIMNNQGKNLVLTGLPYMDIYLRPRESFTDPWKNKDSRKRIIYAPHHTIGDDFAPGIQYSTFLQYGEYMLELAKRYSKKCFFAFKPHPVLYKKLVTYWGKERTDSYYQSWGALENAQIEMGDYISLFKHSDAMIHDCCSFMIEYHYSHNPALYLMNGGNTEDNLTDLAKNARACHYKAYTYIEIDQFIDSVINGKDPLKKDRDSFFKKYLVPTNNKSACENIINSILGR